jgi:cytochrome c biogenesis protein CcmG, thiol:disulfide interchange protein DsbE
MIGRTLDRTRGKAIGNAMGKAVYSRPAVCLIALAMLSLPEACSREADARAGGAPSTASSSVGVPLASPRIPDAATDAKGPADVVLRMLDTEAVRGEMRKALGRVMFVHLWASWCGPCLAELPVMERFAQRARARGAVVLSISLDSEYRGIARVPTVLRARAPSLTVAVAHYDDADQFISLFSKSWQGTIPTVFAFDRAGKLHRSLVGEVESAELDTVLSELLSSPSRAPAR